MSQLQDNNELAEAINQMYMNQLNTTEADEAANNLVGLFEMLIEIHQGQEQ